MTAFVRAQYAGARFGGIRIYGMSCISGWRASWLAGSYGACRYASEGGGLYNAGL
jgi:hypothetical protein